MRVTESSIIDISNCKVSENHQKPSVSAIAIGEAALVHILPTHTAKTFGEFAQNIFIPHLQHCLDDSMREDVMFDRYIDGSLKSDTRKSRGSGQKITLKASTTIPRIFSKFLMVDANKFQIFRYLSEKINTNNECYLR